MRYSTIKAHSVLPPPADPDFELPAMTDEQFLAPMPLDVQEDATLIATGAWGDEDEPDDGDDEEA